MNDTNNTQGGSSFGGGNNGNGGNNTFNNNSNTPRPNPVTPASNPSSAPAPANLPTGNISYGGNTNGATTPKFSGMPAAPGSNNSNTSMNRPSQPSMPTPTPAPKPPMPQPAQSFQQAPRPTTPPVTPPVSSSSNMSAPKPMSMPSSNPAPTPAPMPKPAPAPMPAPTQAPVPHMNASTMGSFTPKPASAPLVVEKKSGKGLGATIIVLLVIILVGIVIWAFKPFAFMSAPATTNLEDKMANPVPANTNNSAFPTGVVTNNKPAAPQAPKPVTTKSSNTYSVSDQQKITAYLQQNINRLAKTTGYSVDDVTFDGPGRAVVSFSKGSISKSAVVNAYVDSSGAVKVTSFMVLTK